MTPLQLSPLPTARRDNEPLMMEQDGFVDEECVTALVASPLVPSRHLGYPEDLALAVDDLDFAGWKLATRPEPKPTHPGTGWEIPARRPAPPVVDEPGLGSPHSGSHRWWLAGLAGLFSTFLISTLLFSLSSRPGISFETLFTPRPISASATIHPDSAPPKVAAELTKVSISEP
jgi:hypothetical protein